MLRTYSLLSVLGSFLTGLKEPYVVQDWTVSHIQGFFLYSLSSLDLGTCHVYDINIFPLWAQCVLSLCSDYEVLLFSGATLSPSRSLYGLQISLARFIPVSFMLCQYWNWNMFLLFSLKRTYWQNRGKWLVFVHTRQCARLILGCALRYHSWWFLLGDVGARDQIR